MLNWEWEVNLEIVLMWAEANSVKMAIVYQLLKTLGLRDERPNAQKILRTKGLSAKLH